MKITTFILTLLILINCKESAFKKQTYTPIDYDVPKVSVKKQDQAGVPLPEKKAIYAVLNTSSGNIVLELFDKDAPKTVQNFIDLAQGEKETINITDGKPQKIKFYNGLKFHRVIDGFMIQGGCPKGDGTGGPGYKFDDEINAVYLGLDTLKGTDVPFYDRFFQDIVIREMGVKSQEELEKRMKEAEEKLKKAKEMSIVETLFRVGYKFNEVLKSHKSERGTIAMANAGPNTNGSQFFINQVDNPHLIGLHTVFGKVVAGLELVDGIAKAGNNNTTINSVSIIDRR